MKKTILTAATIPQKIFESTVKNFRFSSPAAISPVVLSVFSNIITVPVSDSTRMNVLNAISGYSLLSVTITILSPDSI